MIKLIATLLIMISPMIAHAADSGFMDSLYENLGFYLVGGATLVVVIAAFSTLLKILDMVVRNKEGKMAKEEPEAIAVPSQSETQPLWRRLYSLATKSVPLSREKEILLDHN
jgi:hypothetical protein